MLLFQLVFRQLAREWGDVKNETQLVTIAGRVLFMGFFIPPIVNPHQYALTNRKIRH